MVYAYEETIHVPFIIHSPKLFSGRRTANMLTSHVDILPTLLGLADINVTKIANELQQDHTEVHPLVGRNLSPVLYKKDNSPRAHEPVYFMSDDDVTRGLNQIYSGQPYQSVTQPNHLETVIAQLPTGINNTYEIWKFTRYYDNPQFWSNPGIEDQTTEIKSQIPIDQSLSISVSKVTTKTQPVPEQYELYNLTNDPLEIKNLSAPSNVTDETKLIQKRMKSLLVEQCKQKRLHPSSGLVPGQPNCNDK